MSKLNRLQPFKEAPPPERASCRACRTFAPECLVPVGDDALPMCWLCAHHVIEHDVALQAAHSAECDCLPQAIYPNRACVIATVKPEPEPVNERAAERDRLLNASPAELKRWIAEAHKQMSLSQHAAVKRRLS